MHDTELTDVVTYFCVGLALIVWGAVSEVLMLLGATVITRHVILSGVL